jgi:hypothetical protein
MSVVGIIANPASGKDIRRLVAYGSVFDNLEKAHIVRRVLVGLAATGIRQVLLMPEWFGIGSRALEGLHLPLEVTYLEMEPSFTHEDSTNAARLMRALGARCLVTLGGDGTNRAVAKASADVPLLPISTGTNNVFPSMVEGTVAGLAAGVVARGGLDLNGCLYRARRLEIEEDGRLVDIALVDVAVCDELFVGARAIWDPAKVREVFLASVRPGILGLSALGSALAGINPGSDGEGLWIRTGDGPFQVLAPILPGVLAWVQVEAFLPMRLGDALPVHHQEGILALDGEREIPIRPGVQYTVRLSDSGPWVVDVQKVLARASQEGYFLARGRG